MSIVYHQKTTCCCLILYDLTPWYRSPLWRNAHNLKAVINEVLRIHPPASWFGRGVDEPTEVCGVILPRGLSVGLSPWAFHRATSIWGEDASELKPERWLQSDKPMVTTSENQAWLTFGAGPRRCVGRALAKAELYCVLARVFRRFQLKFDDAVPLPKISHHITVAYRESLRVQVAEVEVGEGVVATNN